MTGAYVSEYLREVVDISRRHLLSSGPLQLQVVFRDVRSRDEQTVKWALFRTQCKEHDLQKHLLLEPDQVH